jgi:hypothetical protein
VRVTARDALGYTGQDASNANFTIVNPDATPPTVAVLAPNGGETFPPGFQTTITWNASDTGMNAGVMPAAVNGVDSVSISYSLNGGASWTVEATGEANDGTYDWSVPGVPSDSVLVRVEAWDPSLNMGSDQSNSLFTIAGQSGVGPIPTHLTLAQNRPNPMASSDTRISFGLTHEGPVTLRIFDAQGRQVAELVRGSYPAGTFEVHWDGRAGDGAAVTAGIYFYRLETQEGVLNRKLMVVR